ncbi:unnamed protein product [Clavelina lepadiformis]|uniref:NTR domain-containing protein n=1 Tax=Clavelina lepadiformis TaxID=159417 RepID=A0ABP0H390_CLALP
MKIALCFLILIVTKETFGSYYTIAAPKAFRIDAPETVILNCHYEGPVTISSFLNDLPNKDNVFGQTGPVTFQVAKNQPIPIQVLIRNRDVPNFRRIQTVLLTVEMTPQNQPTITKEIEVLLSKKSGYLFLVTDRPAYKPGEQVNIRVFPLDQAMRPNGGVPVTITVKTPDGVGVHEINKTLPHDEFLETIFTIPENADLDDWFVEASYAHLGYDTNAQVRFSVERYVLPTYEVQLIPKSSFILLTDDFITGTIKAFYSYGRPVNGKYFLSAKVKRTADGLPVEFYRRPAQYTHSASISGTEPYNISVRALIDGDPMLHDNGGSISLEVTVRGEAEGILESASTPEIPFLRSPYVINTKRASKYFTPGLVYKIQLDIEDAVRSDPLPSIGVIITVRGRTSGQQSGVYPTTSDRHGSIDYLINFPQDKEQEIHVVTAAQGVEDEDQAEALFTVQPYSSPSRNYLQIFSENSLVEVSQRQFFVTFRYNTENRNELGEIRYYIVARGTVVAYGINYPRPGSEESAQTIQITHEMVPSMRIIAYYIIRNEVVSNSLWIDVVDSCREELTVQVPNEVEPGQGISFDITGPAHSLVSLVGVDRAAYFVFNESRFTRDTMFSKMRKYDQGCHRHGGADASNVFTEAGVLLASPTLVPPRVRTLDCDSSDEIRSRKKRQALGAFDAHPDIDAALHICDRDGRLAPAIPGENCERRTERCKQNYGERFPNCTQIFKTACYQAARERQISRFRGLAGRSSGDRAAADVSSAQQRKYFEESLAFTHVKLDQNGKYKISQSAKDSITTFDIDAVSMSDKPDGFCVAPPTQVRVFKNLFVQLYTPFSLKKAEQAVLRFSVFNYSPDEDYNVIVDVRTDESGDLCSLHREGVWSELIRLNVPSEDSYSGSFTVLPLRVPKASQTVSVEIRVKYDDRSGKVADSVIKEILVEEPGEPQSVSKPYPIDLKNRPQEVFPVVFEFPNEVVPGSQKCWLYAYANFLGPTIEIDPVTKKANNIDNIFRQPTGCGEQTISKSGPNIYAHMYLTATGQLVPETPAYEESLERMRFGLTQQMSHRSTQVNLQAFAVYANIAPEIGLNAYASKVYNKAKQYATDLNMVPVCNSFEWMLNQQQDDGMFFTRYLRFRGAVRSHETLTAYVLIALIETPNSCSQSVRSRIGTVADRAVAYLQQSRNNQILTQDPYAMSILSYALELYGGSVDFSNEVYERLMTFKTENSREAFWLAQSDSRMAGTNSHAYWYQRRPRNGDVEATAYTMLAILQRSRSQNPPEASQETLDLTRKIMIWLIRQRNEFGYFGSTQDTVIGLQAMATYQLWIREVEPLIVEEDIDINLSFTSAHNTEWQNGHSVHLDRSNQRIKKEIEVPDGVRNSGGLTVTATGYGEGVVTHKCIYRTFVDEESCHFEIASDVIVQNHNQQRINSGVPIIIKFTLTVAKREGDPTKMTMIEVGLLSGFFPVESTVKRLSAAEFADGIVDRYEISNHNVVFYLKEITTEGVVLSFDMVQNIPVAKPEPAKINVYDYYEPFIRCGTFYNLPDDLTTLRTTDCDDDVNVNNPMCRCAEGGCLTCRTRDEQLNNATCFVNRRQQENCETCKGSNCFNLIKEPCSRNYFYLVKVTNATQNQGLFKQFSAEIIRVIKEGSDKTVTRNDVNVKNKTVLANFYTRNDCYRKCKDESVDKSPDDRNYLKVGSVIAVMGSSVVSVTRNQGVQLRYNLDESAILERYIPDGKCARQKATVHNLRCHDSSYPRTEKQESKCQRALKMDEACRNFQEIRKVIENGCD